MQRIDARHTSQSERTRNHIGIAIGNQLIEHARRNPGSEVRQVAIRIIENHLKIRPKDTAVVDLLAELKGTSPAPDGENFTSDDAAELISNAAE